MEFQDRDAGKARKTTRKYYEKKEGEETEQIEKGSKERTYNIWILAVNYLHSHNLHQIYTVKFILLCILDRKPFYLSFYRNIERHSILCYIC